MPHPLLEQALKQVETQLEGLHGALRANDPQALEPSATRLRNAAFGFAQAVEQHRAELALADRPFLRRIAAAGQRLAGQRENLARRQAVVERHVKAILPEAAPTAPAFGSRAGGGAAARMYQKHV